MAHGWVCEVCVGGSVCEGCGCCVHFGCFPWVKRYSLFLGGLFCIISLWESNVFLLGREEVNRTWKKESKECQRLSVGKRKIRGDCCPGNAFLVRLSHPSPLLAPVRAQHSTSPTIYSSNQNSGKDYNCRDAGTSQFLCFVTNASLHSLIAPPPTQYSTWRPWVSSESYPALSMGEQLVRSSVPKMKGRRPCYSRSKALPNHYRHRKDLDANWHRNVSLYRLWANGKPIKR